LRNSGSLGKWEIALIKLCPLTDDSALGIWIPEFPTFVTGRISNEHTLLHMRAQLTAFVLLHMHISSTAPDAKMTDIRLLLVPEFIRGGAFDGGGRATIAHMYKGAKSFAPELTR
jgi:hypothetical protein